MVSGQKSFLDRGNGDAPRKAGPAVTDVEQHAAFSRFPERRVHFARWILLAADSGVHVRVNVIRPQLDGDELRERTLRSSRTEIDHHGNVGQRARFNGALDGRPFRSGEVRGLDAHDDARIPARHVGGRLCGHVLQILLEFSAAHAVPDDVQERQNASRGAIDDALLEVLEIAPARSADVDDRRDARTRRHDIGIDAVVTGIGSGLARSRVHMRVNVDETGRHEQA